MSGSYRDLKAWQKGMELVTEVYSGTRTFPQGELYGLTAQLRRSAVSIPSNIAEGKGRSSDKELILFLHHARGSLFELETQIDLAHRLGYLTQTQTNRLRDQAAEVARMLAGLIGVLKEGGRRAA